MSVIPNAAPPEVEDAELLARCKRGDRAAQRLLYEQHYSAVRRTARYLGTPPADVDDVVQDVFTHAFRQLDRFKTGSFAHWVHRICANVVTDLHRRHRVRQLFRGFWGGRDESEEVAPAADAAVERRQAQAQVAEILARLRPKHREVFALFELEGLSGEEIAARVGCTVNTVWSRLFHARRAFVRVGRKRGWVEIPGGRP
jgi:RNA polymerase sigma-70 factor (ECF subfamily)